MIRNINKFSIGATAAITTSMGLIAGLTQGEGVKTGILTALLVVAIADNISDSLGIHIYKEAEGASQVDINVSTYGNFFTRLLIVCTFMAIVVFFSSQTAFIISSIWGLVLLVLLSYSIARSKKSHIVREVIWHLTIALFVIVCSKVLGSVILRLIIRS